MSSTSQHDAAAILRKHGIRPRYRLGQNFLHDPIALQRIVQAGEIQRSDVVLEIGCGFGSLTRHLARAAHHVVAVEVDPRLADIARADLLTFQNVTIVTADILDTTPQELELPAGHIIVANIPYYITSPILRHVLEGEPKPRRVVLTVQQEVAARICATPPDMSVLALGVQVYGEARLITTIPAEAFFPVPKVDSAVVCIERYDQPAVPSSLLPIYFTVVRAGFSQPRKMLGNTLAAGLRISAADSRAELVRAGIDPRRRAETLTIDEWAQLSEVLSNRTS